MEPVDLTNLRSMIDGDKELERELFQQFFVSFQEGIEKLRTGFREPETWRKNAHALKGIALNLGAEQLGLLCKQAQENTVDHEKEGLLKHIETEYARVTEYLHRVQA